MVNVVIESLTLSEAFLLSLLGIGVVFIGLLLLMGSIKLSSWAISLTRSPGQKPAMAGAGASPLPGPAGSPAASSIPPGKVPAPGSLGEICLHTVDDKTAAMLMAITADKLGAPLNELRFISIREIKK